MLLDAILERNRAYLHGRKRRVWPPNPRVQLAVVACYDPRLDAMIPEAIGIQPGEAFVFRTAGAFLREGSASLRSLAMAIYFFDVNHVLVMGHPFLPKDLSIAGVVLDDETGGLDVLVRPGQEPAPAPAAAAGPKEA